MQCQIVVFLLWSETLRHVEPRGSPRSFADEWVEGTNPASLYHSADTLAMHLPDKWCSNTTIHVVTEQPREQRDYYLGITWVVKTPDNNSVQEQCSMNNKIDFDLWVNVYDCDEWFLDWILMIALKRQKCFHIQKWESIIAGESLKNWEQISLLLCLVFLIPWFLCGQDVAWYKHFGGKLAAEWVPYLQTHIKSKLSGPSCDPRWFSGASFWTVAHFHPGWWNIKARHFSVCNRVSKILTLRNRTFPLKETFYVLLISLFPLVIIFYNELHICQGVLLC